jgi:hypothetical protein
MQINPNATPRGALARSVTLVYRVYGSNRKFQNGMAVRQGSIRATLVAFQSGAGALRGAAFLERKARLG